MKALLLGILSVLLTIPTVTMAAPSETNYFYIQFSGEDAERFRNTNTKENHYNYGDNDSNLSKNYYIFFTKDEGNKDLEFNLEISCQQRVLKYKSKSPELLAPSCYFTYQNNIMYTNIIMTDEISAKMITNLKWAKYKHKTDYFYGCYDNMEAGCPTIRYSPKTDKNQAELDIRFFKP